MLGDIENELEVLQNKFDAKGRVLFYVYYSTAPTIQNDYLVILLLQLLMHSTILIK